MPAKRTLIGMLTPSSNTALEPITTMMLAGLPEVTAHFGRFRVKTIALSDSALSQFDDSNILAAADLLSDAELHAIAWNGTSSSWLGFESDELLCKRITERTGIPAGTSVLAINEILRATGARDIAFVTPYTDDVQERINANYAKAGFNVVAERHLGLSHNFSFSEVTEEEIIAMTREVAKAKPQAIIPLCTNLRSAPLVEALEKESGIPIYDSISTAVWKCLKLSGVDPKRVQAWGALIQGGTMSLNRLAGRTALITGGNTGIGRAVALAYAAEGADVAVLYVAREDEAKSLVAEIEALGRRAMAVRADVTLETEVDAAFAKVIAGFGHLDVLVNNAGIQRPQPITEMSVADWDRMMSVHLRGQFLCSRAAARHMQARKRGWIINLCSQLGYIGRENYTAYSAAKGGVIAFTRALAKEMAPYGVLVNGVSPGLVDTGFDPLPEDVKVAHAASLPLKRLGTPEDMTPAFVFLASDEARYYCGQLLHPNGGEIMP